MKRTLAILAILLGLLVGGAWAGMGGFSPFEGGGSVSAESDPVFLTAKDDNGSWTSDGSASKWPTVRAMIAWVNSKLSGYLTTESDPVYLAAKDDNGTWTSSGSATKWPTVRALITWVNSKLTGYLMSNQDITVASVSIVRGLRSQRIQLCEGTGQGNNCWTLKAPDNSTSGFPNDYLSILPSAKPTVGQILRVVSIDGDNGTLEWVDNNVTIASFAWDGGGSAIPNDRGKRCSIVEVDGNITMVDLSMSANTTTTIKIYKDAFSTTALPTTEITGGAFITTAGSTRGIREAVPAGWMKTVSRGQEICADMTANDVAQWAALKLYGKRL